MDKTVQPVSGEDAEAAYEKFVWDNLRRNYAGHYLHGMLGMTGFRIMGAPTFLPAYIHSISGSDFIVGLALALQQLGGIVSPIIGASQIEHRKKVLPISIFLGTGMRLPMLGIAIAAWTLSGEWLVGVTMLMLFIMGFFSGAQRVAFQMLLAKVIPISRRGRLQAWRNVTGGAVAAGLSFLAGKYLLEQNAFGNGYATTFVLVFILTSAGLTALRLLMVEPEPPTVRAQTRLRDRMKDFPALLSSDRDFMFFMIVLVFAVAGRIAAPFYILYAASSIELTGANIGLLSLAYLGADTATNLIWGYTGDKMGFRATFIAALGIWIAGTVLLLNVTGIWPIFGAFFLIGAAQSGYMMSANTMVLEFGDRDDMPMRLGLVATVEGVMASAGPLLGGLFAAGVGYAPLFIATTVSQVFALFLLIFRVKDPRSKRAAG